MKLFLLILGIVVVALNVFLYYSKKHRSAASNGNPLNNINKSDSSKSDSEDFLSTPEAVELKQAAAAELGISVEKLNRMSVKEIAHLAAQRDTDQDLTAMCSILYKSKAAIVGGEMNLGVPS